MRLVTALLITDFLVAVVVLISLSVITPSARGVATPAMVAEASKVTASASGLEDLAAMADRAQLRATRVTWVCYVMVPLLIANTVALLVWRTNLQRENSSPELAHSP